MTITITVPGDFSFPAAMQAHGWRRLLPFSWNEDTNTLERVERLDDGRVVLMAVRDAGENHLEVTASEPVDEDALRGLVSRLLQWDLPIHAFHTFCAACPELAHVPEKRQGRMLVSPTIFEDVVKVIATTNTTWTQTIAMTKRIVEAYGSPLPSDPARRAFPTPSQIAGVPFEDFAATAKLGYRNAAVHRIASEIASEQLDLEAFRDRETSTADLKKRISALPGVGPYSAACLMIYLGRYETVNVDSWARTLVGKELGRAVTDKEAHAFFEPYGEWRALAYHFYAWKEQL